MLYFRRPFNVILLHARLIPGSSQWGMQERTEIQLEAAETKSHTSQRALSPRLTGIRATTKITKSLRAATGLFITDSYSTISAMSVLYSAYSHPTNILPFYFEKLRGIVGTTVIDKLLSTWLQLKTLKFLSLEAALGA